MISPFWHLSTILHCQYPLHRSLPPSVLHSPPPHDMHVPSLPHPQPLVPPALPTSTPPAPPSPLSSWHWTLSLQTWLHKNQCCQRNQSHNKAWQALYTRLPYMSLSQHKDQCWLLCHHQTTTCANIFLSDCNIKSKLSTIYYSLQVTKKYVYHSATLYKLIPLPRSRPQNGWQLSVVMGIHYHGLYGRRIEDKQPTECVTLNADTAPTSRLRPTRVETGHKC